MAKERVFPRERTELSWVTRMHWASKHHVVILEASMAENDKRRIFHMSKKLRLFRNSLVYEMQKRVGQLFRTKRYRKLSQALDVARGKLRRTPEHSTLLTERRAIIGEMKAMQREYRLTWNDCREAGIRLTPRFAVPSIFALTKAEDVWKAISRQLNDGVARFTPIKFRSRFDWATMRAKQIERGISVVLKNNRVWFRIEGLSFTFKDNDDFIRREMMMVSKYLADAERINAMALETFKTTGVAMDTFKPCYVTIVPKEIRGRLRIFLHLAVEGAALCKERSAELSYENEQLRALAEVRERYEKKRSRLRAEIEFARRAVLSGKPMRRSWYRLRSRYQDNKRNLRGVLRAAEKLNRSCSLGA